MMSSMNCTLELATDELQNEATCAHDEFKQGFPAGTLAKELRLAKKEYLLSFPLSVFPDRVSPWWVVSPEKLRARTASGCPYIASDEPKVDDHGQILIEGTDGV